MTGWLLDAADLLAEPDPGPTAWLVDGLIVDGAIVAAVGRWKTTKSYGLLDLCISVATGRPAFGTLEIPNPGPVVFVNEESGRAALWRRLDALCRGRAINPEELRGRLHVGANARVKLDAPDWQKRLLELGQELRPRLFVFDPLARMKDSARDENAQGDMAALIEFLRTLRDESGATVAFVHHTGHLGGHMRGSSDLESAWETRLTWTREGQSPLVEIESEHREAESGPTIKYRINWHGETRTMRFDLVDVENPALPLLADRLADWLVQNPGSKTTEIAKGVQVRVEAVRRTLAEMLDAGRVQKGRSGRTDKIGRPLNDEVWNVSTQTVIALPAAPATLNQHLRDGASHAPSESTPGTHHGTHHVQPRTHQDTPPADAAQTRSGSRTVPRPDNGTHQDAPDAGHRGSVPRPTPLGGDGRDEPPDEAHEHYPLDEIERLADLARAVEDGAAPVGAERRPSRARATPTRRARRRPRCRGPRRARGGPPLPQRARLVNGTPLSRFADHEASRLVDAAAVAEYLNVERGWVYEHAAELRARRLGSGPRARLRFSLADVDAALSSCSASRGSQVPSTPVDKPIRRRRRTGSLGTSVQLLPIRGRMPGSGGDDHAA